MSALQHVSREVALAEIPDSPSTLEFRAVALEPNSTVIRSGGGLLLADNPPTLCGAMGPVVERDFAELQEAVGRPRELLADRSAFDALKASYPFERAKIAVLDGDWGQTHDSLVGLEIRPLRLPDTLDHLPGELFDELQTADGLIHAGFMDGLAIAFAYCASMAETLADISIDTLEGYRRRGIARAVVSRLIDDIVQRGRSPVWGALEDNAASLGLAASLGFVEPAGELFVYERE